MALHSNTGLWKEVTLLINCGKNQVKTDWKLMKGLQIHQDSANKSVVATWLPNQGRRRMTKPFKATVSVKYLHPLQAQTCCGLDHFPDEADGRSSPFWLDFFLQLPQQSCILQSNVNVYYKRNNTVNRPLFFIFLRCCQYTAGWRPQYGLSIDPFPLHLYQSVLSQKFWISSLHLFLCLPLSLFPSWGYHSPRE